MDIDNKRINCIKISKKKTFTRQVLGLVRFRNYFLDPGIVSLGLGVRFLSTAV